MPQLTDPYVIGDVRMASLSAIHVVGWLRGFSAVQIARDRTDAVTRLLLGVAAEN
jgi:hypothetical protein